MNKSMKPDELQRVGSAIADRIDELNTTAAAVAEKAGLHPNTVRALVRGRRWPRNATRERINKALGWPDGQIARVALAGSAVEKVSTEELARILYERLRSSRYS